MKSKEEIFRILTEIFRIELEDQQLVITESSSANNVEGWNSINNIVIITEIERKFNITFSIDVIFKIETAGDICNFILDQKK
jgi:acyl carrier protein